MNLRQPILGITSTIICIIIALTICAQFSIQNFNSWVAFIVTAMIPSQIILALVWDSSYPKWLTKFKQPIKGLFLFILMVVMGLIAVFISLLFIGDSITPPTPMVIMFTILSVVITMWLVVVWQCWPLSMVTKHPAIIGLGTLALTYLITFAIFDTLFNFNFLSDASFYTTVADPSGLLNAWTVLSFFLTTVALIDALILLDFWPMTRLQKKVPIFEKQPVFGMINTVFILLFSYCIWHIFVTYLNMDVVEYTVEVIVSFIFGEFIMLVMMQTAPFTQLKQPYKGGCLLVSCGLLALCMYWLYRSMSMYIVGPVASGSPTYDLELWIATAMLSITFPLLIIFGEFFEFKPLGSKEGKDQRT
ncbi:MAG: hypothetical protein HRT51_06300 [Colwellia sp.]|nr:hypothetical protein [Colwellia sp.]